MFGPVLTVLTFRTAKEGIALANNTNYGLAGSVWTENLSLALEVALSIKAGSLWVNGHNMFDAAAGFGGYRESGFGRDGGKEVRSKSQSCSQAHSLVLLLMEIKMFLKCTYFAFCKLFRHQFCFWRSLTYTAVCEV